MRQERIIMWKIMQIMHFSGAVLCRYDLRFQRKATTFVLFK